MITPWDEDYKATKLIKRHGTALPAPYRELADWIDAQYNVRVLNIILDAIAPNNRPRLNVVLEWEADQQKFLEKPVPNFDVTAQAAIRAKFLSLNNELGAYANSLLVIFSSFEDAARMDANQHVGACDIRRLKKLLADPDLWKIRTLFAGVTFFYYTDAQLHAHQAAGAAATYAREYARVVQRYDEFGYLLKRPIDVKLDSKENFAANFNSNWFYYDR